MSWLPVGDVPPVTPSCITLWVSILKVIPLYACIKKSERTCWQISHESICRESEVAYVSNCSQQPAECSCAEQSFAQEPSATRTAQNLMENIKICMLPNPCLLTMPLKVPFKGCSIPYPTEVVWTFVSFEIAENLLQGSVGSANW